MKAGAALLLTMALVGRSPASAAEKDMQGMTLVDLWRIAPEAVVAKSGDIPPWTIILKQRLLPSGLIETREQLVDGGYGVALPAGTHLVAIQSDIKGLYCTIDLKLPLGTILAHGMGGFSQLCAADTDADGKLDSIFYKTAMAGYPPMIFGGRRPMRSLPPVAFDVVDPQSLPQPAYIAILYNGTYGREKKAVFKPAIGGADDKSLQWLSNYIDTPNGTYPQTLNILGSEVTIESVGEKRHAQITVKHPMPGQIIGLSVH